MNDNLPDHIAWSGQNFKCIGWYALARIMLFISDMIAVPRRWAFSHWRAAEAELGHRFPELED